MIIEFYKYQGTGNDFIIIDDRTETFDVNDHGLIAALCERRMGIGADGLILLRNHESVNFEMIYFKIKIRLRQSPRHKGWREILKKKRTSYNSNAVSLNLFVKHHFAKSSRESSIFLLLLFCSLSLRSSVDAYME